MDLTAFKQQLSAASIAFKENEPLAPYTTWKIGGPADIFVNTTTNSELTTLLKLVQSQQIPFTILGAASNVLISDEGIRGLVIKDSAKQVTVANVVQEVGAESDYQQPAARLIQLDTESYYSFEKVDFDESAFPKVEVVVDAGLYLPYAINYLIGQGITGLQWFAGIPGSIGGAVYNNIHGGHHFISEYVTAVNVLNEQGQTVTIPLAELEFDYDYSRFQHTKEVILSVKLNLYKGDKEKAAKAAMAWAQIKKLQPYRSAGCCFKNLTTAEMEQTKLDSNSWGYINDKILGLKGKQVGDAQISLKHAAFIENLGKATAKDVLALLKLVYETADVKIGLHPKPEIFFLGFAPQEIQQFI